MSESNDKKLLLSPAVPLQATCDYQSSEAVSEPSARRPKVVLLTGSAIHNNAELQTLLWQRLRVIATIAAIGFGLSALQQLLALRTSPDAGLLEFVGRRPWVMSALILSIAYVAMAATLWRKRPQSLPVLRLYELFIFGGGIVFFGYENWNFLNNRGFLPEVLKFDNALANSQNLLWFAIIVAYGTLIPNTGRRCALVVGFVALVALALNGASLAANALSGTDFIRYLIQMGIWLFAAITIATVGSHRLERLRREAFAARRLGQYQLKERLGAGGMGEVYLGEHLLLRRPCAIKLIRAERAGEPQQLHRFEREVRATATLTHPNTVQIYDYGHAEDGTFYYAMEYLPGLTLDQLLQQHGPLPPARAIHLLRQLCGSLQEAHGIGLIHRDIKPGNVMICDRGGVHDVAKLLDFGLVLAQREGQDGEKLTQEGTIAGTPAYMSPEQAGGKEDLDPRSDIYSLGCVAYFLLTGQSPFAGRSPMRMLAAHLYEPPTPLRQHRPDIPEELQAIVLRCLAKEPAGRFPSTQSLENALGGCHSAGQWTQGDAVVWWRAKAEKGSRMFSEE
jgi:hypothetical protein